MDGVTMQKNSLHGKVAIVTGASTGIGRISALMLAQRGASVALAARRADLLDEAVAQMKSQGLDALALPTDVTDRQQIDLLVQRTLDRWGRVDILVSNAGQYIRLPIRDLTIQDLEHSMSVNFYGHVNVVLAVLPAMRRQGSGHILLVASMDAKKGLPPDAPYVSAKFALSGFGEVLRQELAPAGIAVTTLYPGRVDTPMIEHLEVPLISAKIPARKVADAILRAIDRRPAEVILPPTAYMLYLLNVFSPRLADRAIKVFNLQGWEK
jgi:NAD(P)-dependent dehydrogenase (short-subunit alcohol dehydrogenase family)